MPASVGLGLPGQPLTVLQSYQLLIPPNSAFHSVGVCLDMGVCACVHTYVWLCTYACVHMYMCGCAYACAYMYV